MNSLVGIDVSKARLDVAVHPTGQQWSVSYEECGIAALIQRLSPLCPKLVVLEASGGWERPVTHALGQAGLPVAVVNPRQVRHFAQATGKAGQDL